MSRIATTDLDPSIGDIGPLLANKGRSSTPGPPNESKQELTDVLRIAYHSASPFPPKLRVATIVHDEFYDEIEKKYFAVPLLPSCLIRSIDSLQPNIIVVHRSAFYAGPWFGTEDAAGGASADLIQRIRPWSRKRQVPVIFVDNGMPDRYHTDLLRGIGTEFFPQENSGGRVPEGAPRSAIYELSQQFASEHAVRPAGMES